MTSDKQTRKLSCNEVVGGGEEDSGWSGEGGREGAEAESRRGELEQGKGWTRWEAAGSSRSENEERGGFLTSGKLPKV